jgi:competence protein ComEC
MMKTGTIHILVVSGFNVGIVTFIITLVLKLMRLPRKLRLGLSTPLLIIYCLATGASTPVVRATVMAIVFLAANLIQREADIYNSLCVAMFFILTVNPLQLFDIGFQLSFASVLSIIYLYPKIKLLLRIGCIKTKFVRLLFEGCLVSLSAWLGTLGIIAYYFRIFAPITVFANIFIIPLATLITLCGFSLIFFGLILPSAAGMFAASCELFVLALVQINLFLARLPGAYFSF